MSIMVFKKRPPSQGAAVTSSGFDAWGYPLRYRSAKEAGLGPAIPTEGLVFYAPLVQSTDTAETGQSMSIGSGFTFEQNRGIMMAKSTGESHITFNVDDSFPTTGSRTISCFCESIAITSGYECGAFGWGRDSSGAACLIGVLRESNGRYYFGSLYGADANSTIAGGLHNIIFMYDEPNAVAKLYIDGVQAASAAVSVSVNTPKTNGKIGCAPWNSSGWQGYISACRVYNRVLSDKELKALAYEFKRSAQP